MRSRKLRSRLQTIMRGARLRCPHCGAKGMFLDLVTLRETCPYCLCRFERAQGGFYGGVYVNLAISEILSLTGFFTTREFTTISTEALLIFWLVFSLVFMLLFYRHARGIWIALLYLAEQVYPDPDYEREYIRPKEDMPQPRSPERE